MCDLRASDISTFLSYALGSALAISDKIINAFDQHAAGIGAICQVVGVCVVILTFLWNRSCQIRRLRYHEKHFKEIMENHLSGKNGAEDELD